MDERAEDSPDAGGAHERIAQLVAEADTLMLTTVDGEGRLTSRPMAFVPGAFDGGLWLFTDEASPEALEVRARPQVNAAFAVPARGDWVSLSGTARVVDDPARAAQLWDDRLTAWFVDGPATPGLVLLRVDVDRAEYWDGPGRASTLLGSLRAALTRSADDPLLDSEHRAIEL